MHGPLFWLPVSPQPCAFVCRYGYNERVQQDAKFVQAVVEHTLALMYQHLHIATSQSDDVQAVFGQARPSMSLVAASGERWCQVEEVLVAPGCCWTMAAARPILAPQRPRKC